MPLGSLTTGNITAGPFSVQTIRARNPETRASPAAAADPGTNLGTGGDARRPTAYIGITGSGRTDSGAPIIWAGGNDDGAETAPDALPPTAFEDALMRARQFAEAVIALLGPGSPLREVDSGEMPLMTLPQTDQAAPRGPVDKRV